MKNRIKLVAVIPAVWVCLFDVIITLVYQPAEYWSGDLSLANEANPIGAFVMKYHTSGLFILSALWLGLIVLLGYYLPKKWASIFLLFVFIAHCFGGASWVNIHFGFWAVMLFFLFNSILYHRIDTLVKCNEK
ncbi:hypothetical protein BZG02_13605 [Labilibaculum filiforme]|uniref:DUF5658 domain-containing protein n=1 Tax=Labilibaculum filiforme TaxID=1940526 RepID=A0A2N3HVC0_9BACT|nr:hypothetical protein [Labilibaculum filiforme]PKQ61971.1 hypothetical protein BZG02_13605 [Labilibaculum filiforme]